MPEDRRAPVRTALLLLLAAGLAPGDLLGQPPAGAPKREPPASEVPAPPPPADAPAPEPPPPGRPSFQLPIPAEQGGGTVTGTAGAIEFLREAYVVLEQGVELHYQDVTVKAERVEVDLAKRVVVAMGDVVIDQGSRRIAGATATYDLGAKTGAFTDATAYADPDIYFSGERLEKVGENTYVVERGTFTSCSDEVPNWSFRLRRARVEVEGYARLRGVSMRVKRMPVLYFPYVLWPAKSERSSGLLIPQPGYSNRRGTTLSLGYFQTLGRSYDTTLYADLSSEDYLGLGNELRWAPSAGSRGELNFFTIRDPDTFQGNPHVEEWRWRASLDHESTDLPFGMRGVVALRDYSDFDFFRDFERDVDRNSIRAIYSNAFASGNWGPHSLNLLLDDRDTLTVEDNPFTPDDEQRSIVLRRLPEVEYQLRSTRLGRTPLFLDLESSAAYLSVDRPAEYEGSYGRLDLFPNLKVPVKIAPWLSFAANAGYRFTWWGDSLCRPGVEGDGACGAEGVELTGETLTRALPSAGAEVVGPSFSRIFETRGGKLRHVIEPRFTYTFLDELDEEELGRAPSFDEVDAVAAGNVGRFELVNRLVAKPSDGKGSAREVLSLRLGQSISFDRGQPLQVSSTGEEERRGPISALLRFEPGGPTSLQAQALYNTQFDQIVQRSLSGSLGIGKSTVGLTWYTRFAPETGDEQDDQARLNANLKLLPDRLELQAQLSYDLAAMDDEPKIQQQRYLLSYTSQCYAFRFEAREFRRLEGGDIVADRDYRFLLTLKNVGTFLDLSGRTSTGDEY